jgi:hypothetical protein
MAPYMRNRARLLALFLAPAALCRAALPAAPTSPDACQVIPTNQIRGILNATDETITPVSSQLQPNHTRCVYTIHLKDLDNAGGTNQLTIDYLRFSTPDDAIKLQHAIGHLSWDENYTPVLLDIPTTSAVNEDEVVSLHDYPPPLPPGAPEPYLGYAFRHQGNVVSLVLSRDLPHTPDGWFQHVATAGMVASGATVLDPVVYARLHDACKDISLDEIQTLVTLDIAVTSAESSSKGVTMSCDFNVQTGFEEKDHRVGLQVTRFANMQEAQGAFREGIAKDRAKYSTLVHTSDATDQVITDSADHTQQQLQVRALHGSTVSIVTIYDWFHQAFAHPTFEYRLERLALQTAGATVQPTPGMAPDPIAQKPTLAFRIEKQIRRYWADAAGTGILVLIFGLIARSGATRRRVLSTGLPGTARVEYISDTGSTINQQPVVLFTCTVTPQNGVPYRATIRQAASRLSAPSSLLGKTLDVRIDPKNQQRVFFVNIDQRLS